MPKAMTKEGANARFNKLVQKRMALGMSRREAIQRVARENPRLHGLTKLESSPKASKAVKNGIRAQHGLRQK